MKRGTILASVAALAVLVVAALFLPSYLARRGLDRLATSLPSGTTFRYADAHYSLWTRSLVLDGAVLHTASPALDIDIAEVRIQDGNPALDGAVKAAQDHPDLASQNETRLAGTIQLTGLHTVYGPLDARAAHVALHNVRLILPALFAPLPALKPAPGGGPAGAVPDTGDLRRTIQLSARAALASATDSSSADGIEIKASDHLSGAALTAHLGRAESRNGGEGAPGSASLEGLTADTQGITVSLGKLAAEVGDQKPMLMALRDGEPFETAFAHYPAVSETLDNMAIKRGDQTVVSVAETSLRGVQYSNGLPISLDMSARGVAVDPAHIPNPLVSGLLAGLGYKPAVFDASLVYKLDPGAKTLTLTGTGLTLENGGIVAVDAAFTGITPGAPPQGAKVSHLTVSYQDRSLFPRWVDYTAQQTGATPAVVKQRYISWLDGQKAAVKTEPSLLAALNAVEGFVTDPQGLTLSVNPAAPVGLSEYDPAHPQAFVARLNLAVTSGKSETIPQGSVPSKAVRP